jgi:hypothetical protein
MPECRRDLFVFLTGAGLQKLMGDLAPEWLTVAVFSILVVVMVWLYVRANFRVVRVR